MTSLVKPIKRRKLRSTFGATRSQKQLFDRYKSATGWRPFVIQKHAASRLHYDFRLEHTGIFMNWVVHDGPCLDPTHRRDAVLVNDHSIDCYGEGTIPAGLYGAGTILLWDYGMWRTDQDVDEALRAGRLNFELQGKKLKGIWSLIRISRQPDAKGEKWFLRKENDAEAKSLSATDILVAQPLSVVTNRTLAEIASEPSLFIPGKSKRNSKSKKPAPNQLPLFPDDLEP